MKQSHFLIRLVVLLGVFGVAVGQEKSADELAYTYQRDVAYRLRKPMTKGMDVQVALEAYFAGKRAADGKTKVAQFEVAMKALKQPLKPLAKAEWPETPKDVELEFLEEVAIPDASTVLGVPSKVDTSRVECRIVRFEVDGLVQYGVVLRPKAEGKFPLLMYLHGAAFGVPTYQLPWLAEFVDRGYVVIAPALRGEPLFAMGSLVGWEDEEKYKSAGQIENLDGEVNDALGMVEAAYKLPYVKAGKYAMVGHSFGGGVGLLAAARSDKMACSVTYDAWLVNPFRYYWDRLAGRANNWLSWEAYTEQPVEAQLNGLMRRSVVHHAERIQAPMLLFMGGAYNGSVFHQSHDDLVANLKAAEKVFQYEVIPGGGHNFVLYQSDKPALVAGKLQDAWLEKYLPAVKPVWKE